MSHYLLYINSVHRLYNKTALDQLPLPSQVVHSTQQVSWSSSSSMYIGIASTGYEPCEHTVCSNAPDSTPAPCSVALTSLTLWRTVSS